MNDAINLDRNKSPSTAATLIARYTGRPPTLAANRRLRRAKETLSFPIRETRDRPRATQQHQNDSSPYQSPAKLLTQQRGLENLFQEVSGGLQRRAEGWGLAKAVKGAVGEVRRNVNSLQSGTSSLMGSADVTTKSHDPDEELNEDVHNLTRRVHQLEERNKVLAKMLGNALEFLRSQKQSSQGGGEATKEDSFNIALAKIQFVQVYLADSEIPIPGDELRDGGGGEVSGAPLSKSTAVETQSSAHVDTSERDSKALSAVQRSKASSKNLAPNPNSKSGGGPEAASSQRQRPRLAESSFSFMLGEDRRRSSFVSSVTEPPEHRRGSEVASGPNQNPAAAKESHGRRGSGIEDDGFTMSSLRG